MKELDLEGFVAFEPQKENRFIVNIGEPFDNIPSYVIKKINKPGCNISRNGESLYWDPLYISMYNPIVTQLSNIILEDLSKIIKQEESYVNVYISIVDPTGGIIEKWDIKSKFKLVDFGNLDWSSENLSEITLVLDTISVKIK